MNASNASDPYIVTVLDERDQPLSRRASAAEDLHDTIHEALEFASSVATRRSNDETYFVFSVRQSVIEQIAYLPDEGGTITLPGNIGLRVQVQQVAWASIAEAIGRQLRFGDSTAATVDQFNAQFA